MMQEAYQSQVAQWIRFLNQTCYQCAWEGVPWWARGEGYTTAVQADAFSRLGAYALWAWMVRQGGPWDPKPKIAKEYEAHYFRLSDGYVYYYDVWGNVMYGYLGVALGFSEEELFHGAGAEQIGSDIGTLSCFLTLHVYPGHELREPKVLPLLTIPPMQRESASGFNCGRRMALHLRLKSWSKPLYLKGNGWSAGHEEGVILRLKGMWINPDTRWGLFAMFVNLHLAAAPKGTRFSSRLIGRT